MVNYLYSGGLFIIMSFSERNRNVAISRWSKIHSKVRISKKFSKEKSAINAYLCGDGNISIREKGFHYDIRFFIDDLYLARRLVYLFEKEFKISPALRKMKSKLSEKEVGYYKVEICNKPACLHLLSLGSYGSLDWQIPPNLLKKHEAEWLKCFFDCEAYVNSSNRQIQLKSVNGPGLKSVKRLLEKFNIFPKLYGPYKQKGRNHNPYYFLNILGKDNLSSYFSQIGFYHPKKYLDLKSLVNY